MTDEPGTFDDGYAQAQADAATERLVADRITAAGGDPGRLLDSLSFRQAVDDLPDDGFEDGLEQLIVDRVRASQPTVRPRRPVENLRSGALPASGYEEQDPNAWLRLLGGR